jgi:AbrB family looped-hinge helix DNA binding protein
MTAATITSKGQTTIPKDVRDRLDLGPGDRVEFVVRDDGTALMVPTKSRLAELKGCLPPRERPLTLEQLDDAVGEAAVARSRRARS